MNIRFHPLRAAALATLVLALPVHATDAKTSVQVDVKNGKGTIRLNGEEVWSGNVEGNLTSRSSNVNGKEYAAAYDGGKLLWESAPGAGERVIGGLDAQAMIDQAMREHEKTFRRREEQARSLGRSHASGGAGQVGSGDGAEAKIGEKETDNDAPKRMKRQTTTQRVQVGGKERKGDAVKATREAKRASSAHSETGIRIEIKNGKGKATYQGETVWSGKVDGDAPVRALSRNHNGEEDAAVLAGDEILWESSPGAAERVR